MIRFISILMVAAVLSACGTAPVRIETVEVKVPVKVACIDAAPAAPVYQTGVGPYPGEAVALRLLAADFEAAKLYAKRWEGAAIGCVKSP